MIRLVNITKKFDNKTIFNNMNIHIKANEMIAIKGPSGSGKTTLLNIIGLLDDMDEGDYVLNDNILSKKRLENQQIRYKMFSYIFQYPYLIPYLNVYDNITMPLSNKKEAVDKAFLTEVIDVLDIEQLMNKQIGILSGGEKTRISIARALMTKNKIILADEPTGNLDPKNSENIIKLLATIRKKFDVTIVIVTHSNEFDNYFDRVLYINKESIDEHHQA